jgi:hypothetical protein
MLHSFLRATTRNKGGKEYCYFSVVETRRVSGGLVPQRHVKTLRGDPPERSSGR